MCMCTAGVKLKTANKHSTFKTRPQLGVYIKLGILTKPAELVLLVHCNKLKVGSKVKLLNGGSIR